MMKSNNSIFTGWRGVQHQLSLISRLIGAGLAVVVIAAGLCVPAYCQTADTALLLQRTPAWGGEISLGAGIHHFARNTKVTLTAIPEPGYQFVYWLGDVSDPRAMSTIVYLDAPKIVIAIFERIGYEDERELLIVNGGVASGSSGAGGGGRLRRSAADYSRQGYGGSGRRWPPRQRWPELPEPPEPPEEEQEDFPVPEDGNDFPVPSSPEPATGILLALGSLFTLTRRRTKKDTD